MLWGVTTACVDGLEPVANLVEDTSGNLYGMTKLGGANGEGEIMRVPGVAHR